IVDALSRMAHVESDVLVAAVPGDGDANGTGWRTRVRLHVHDGGRPGPYAARSHRVIAVDDLPLAALDVAAIAPLAQDFPGHDHVDVLAPSTGGARLVIGKQKPS